MKRRRQTIIELTPLLDVILILLFMVMAQNAAAAAKAQETAAATAGQAESAMQEMETEMDRLEQENAILRNEVSGYEGFADYAQRISVTWSCDKEEKKHIYVTFAGAGTEGSSPLDISYGWDSARYGENSLRNGLKQKISAKDPVFIFFTYDAKEIYKEDYDMIASVLADLKTDDTYIQYVPEQPEP
jgi:cell division protein FtsB